MTAVQGDAGKLADLDRLYAQIANEKGHIDIVFANAGIVHLSAPLEEITEQQFDETVATNLRGVLFTVQKALPLMRAGGSIVLNASASSIKGLPKLTVYAATKAAIRSFARTWTAELKDRKIRVNTISPGYTETPIFETMGWSKQQIEEIKSDAAATLPLAGWRLRKKSPKLCSSSLPTIAATSPESSCSSTGGFSQI